MNAELIPKWSEALKRFDLHLWDLPVGAEVLGTWLSNDVQSKESAREYVKIITRARDTESWGYLGTGNTKHMMAANGLIFIEDQYLEDEKVLIGIEQILDVLNQYVPFFTNGKETPPGALRVEYEAEGEKALQLYLATGNTPVAFQRGDAV
jgi:hypothetical protein